MRVTQLLYLADSYMRTVDARIVDVEDRNVVLDRTIFFPRGGGQMADRGQLIVHNRKYSVVAVERRGETVFHTVAGTLPPLGVKAVATIDWEFRYTMMRLHSAVHVVAAAVRRLGYSIGGTRIGGDQAHIELIGRPIPPLDLQSIEELSNGVIRDGHPIRVRYVSRNPDESLSIRGLSVAAPPHDATSSRVVEIVDLDSQFDDGTHVANTLEIGGVRIAPLPSGDARHQQLTVELLPFNQD